MNFFAATTCALGLLAGKALAQNSVGAFIQNEPSLSTLSGLIETAGLQQALNQNVPYTVFAPNNGAFSDVPAATLQSLQSNKTALTQLLQGHVVSKMYQAADLKNNQMLPTLADTDLTIMKSGSDIMVMAPMDGTTATVVNADNEAGDGVVHIIDAVLIPGDGSPMMAPMMAPAPGMAPGMAPGVAPDGSPAEAPSGASAIATGLAGIGALVGLALAL